MKGGQNEVGREGENMRERDGERMRERERENEGENENASRHRFCFQNLAHTLIPCPHLLGCLTLFYTHTLSYSSAVDL